MKTSTKLISCVALLAIFGGLAIGSTAALFTSQRTISNHLVTGSLKANLYLTSLVEDETDDKGQIVSVTKDLSTYTGYEADNGVNLVTNTDEVFKAEKIVPTMTGKGTFTLVNAGSIAFTYAVNTTNVKYYTYQDGTYTEDPNAALKDQLEFKVEGVESGTVLKGEKATFTVSYLFKDVENNNDAMDEKVSFDIQVVATQVVKG
jgi:predicted ribosomally synthesized peptide with SipW-like signal peptide